VVDTPGAGAVLGKPGADDEAAAGLEGAGDFQEQLLLIRDMLGASIA
jgi:hypothetical protein